MCSNFGLFPDVTDPLLEVSTWKGRAYRTVYKSQKKHIKVLRFEVAIAQVLSPRGFWVHCIKKGHRFRQSDKGWCLSSATWGRRAVSRWCGLFLISDAREKVERKYKLYAPEGQGNWAAQEPQNTGRSTGPGISEWQILAFLTCSQEWPWTVARASYSRLTQWNFMSSEVLKFKVKAETGWFPPLVLFPPTNISHVL